MNDSEDRRASRAGRLTWVCLGARCSLCGANEFGSDYATIDLIDVPLERPTIMCGPCWQFLKRTPEIHAPLEQAMRAGVVLADVMPQAAPGMH